MLLGQSHSERDRRHLGWSSWFAWRPVFLNMCEEAGSVVWLRSIVRKWDGESWNYRLYADNARSFPRFAQEGKLLHSHT